MLMHRRMLTNGCHSKKGRVPTPHSGSSKCQRCNTLRNASHSIAIQPSKHHPPHKKKSLLDEWNGYHSLPLSKEARDATIFIIEWGRYRYLRAPMGFHRSNDGYTKRFDDITATTGRITRCIDDSLMWDDDL